MEPRLQDELLALARAVLENKLLDKEHDLNQFKFAEFDERDLSNDDLAFCLPILVNLDSASLNADNKSALLDILSSDMSIKILLRVKNINHRWAQQAVALGTAYVWQTTNAHTNNLPSGFTEGLNYNGPALFSVYTDNPADTSYISPYLLAASAVESRAFPTFIYNPNNGSDWQSRFDVSGTPQPERDWSVGELSEQTTEEEETTVELDFTFADFIATDSCFAKNFLPIPEDQWQESMIFITEFLQLDKNQAKDKVPFILMVDKDGTKYRAIVTQTIIRETLKCASNWRNLQELGGINNSHVQKQLAEEQQRLEEDKQREVDEIEKKHQEELEKSIAELTHVIVERIATGLLSEGTMQPAYAPSVPTTAPTVAEAEVAPEEVPVEEEEEEKITFDDPYIDTPLCTTCNECTNLNGKLFNYNENKQAFIKDVAAGTFRDLVISAEKCPVRIIHPGKPKNLNEAGLDDLIKRAEQFN